jgi:phage-related protein
MDLLKPVVWVGNSRQDLAQFPADVMQALGKELLKVQQGLMPNDFKVMTSVGKGVYEIRVKLDGAWRMMYVAKFTKAVYVLHVFRKKTQKTAPIDIQIAKARYSALGE